MNNDQPAPVTLTITFGLGQSPQVSGPLHDKMLCYAMLEIARDAIKDFVPPPTIQVAETIPFGLKQVPK